jgi:hypothetical protein
LVSKGVRKDLGEKENEFKGNTRSEGLKGREDVVKEEL